MGPGATCERSGSTLQYAVLADPDNELVGSSLVGARSMSTEAVSISRATPGGRAETLRVG
jgi:hypothetical protein